MQCDSNKEASNNYGNAYTKQYPPMNQPLIGLENMYSPNNAAPPSYGQYPQQPSDYPAPGAGYPGQTPKYQQQGYVITPIYRSWNNMQSIPIESNTRAFLIISGIFYMIWGIMALGLEIGIIINSYSIYYRSIWAGGCLVSGGIIMLIIACKTSHVMTYLIRTFIIILVLCVLALILSIVNISDPSQCNPDSYWYNYCDRLLATNLNIVMLVLFVIANIHSIINMVVIGKVQKRAATTSLTNIPN
ncbi:unnamed protein product [Adineta steineri]|uniref:Uncharacterized protein n=1 Tax=Adineta steineri TaxID=433720 RepID=A0A815IN87_9BILA|nr:unnamed protein product [Adineta steineri]CAF4164361.1 unnamed protein product [Adineta steineri]